MGDNVWTKGVFGESRESSAVRHGWKGRAVFLMSLVLFGLLLSGSVPTARAETAGDTYDECPCWIKASSDPKLVVSLRLDNNSVGSDWDSQVNWINLTFTNSTLFNASVDLATLSSGSSSGVAIYNETDGTPGFSASDTQAGTPGSWYKESDTIWRLNITFASGTLRLPKTASQKNLYIVIRTSASVSNGDQWKVGLGVSQLNATWGNFPSSSFDSSLITADTVSPSSSVDTIGPYWTNTDPMTVTATASDALSGVGEVRLWYRFSSDNTSWGSWTLFGTDMSSPWSWSFDWPQGDGYYEFGSVAVDKAGNVESPSPPTSADAIAGFDATDPQSSVDTISPYWTNTDPLTVTATASDSLSGMYEVRLWFRYANDNSSWGLWTNFGSDLSPPWSWSFDWPSGDGYYEFASVAVDEAGNVESPSPPTTADAIAGFDSTAPQSSVDTVSPYWTNVNPLTITATASDALSGVDEARLWYRFSSDNTSWGSWTLFGTDTSSPWSWSFGWPSGSGYYEFYTIAVDKIDNIESAPPSKDSSAGHDTAPPSSSAETLPTYETTSTFAIAGSATDSLSGVWYVDLYFEKDAGGWNLYGADYNAPWAWTFNSGSTGGDGVYQFYTRAKDRAGNYESAPSDNDTYTVVDTIAPSTQYSPSGTMGLNGWYTTTVTVTLTPGDNTSGVSSTFYSVDGGSWTEYTTPFTVSGNAVHSILYYSKDKAGNAEAAIAATVKIDTDNPLGTAGAQPSYRTSRTIEVTWQASDFASGVASVRLYFSTNSGITWTLYGSGYTSSPIVFIASSDATYRFNIRAYDVAGNSETAPAGAGSIEATTIVDTVAPVTTDNAPTGWSTSPVTVTFSLSGLPICATYSSLDGDPWVNSTTAQITTDGVHVLEYYSVDCAGNVEAKKTITVKVDAAAPNGNARAQPAYGNSRTIEVTWSGSDATSGVSSVRLYYSTIGGVIWLLYGTGYTSSPIVFIAASDATYNFNIRAYDVAGNSEPLPVGGGSIEATTMVDTAMPETSHILAGTLGSEGWYVSNVTVRLTDTDPAPSSGVAAVWYRVDEGPWTTFPVPFSIASDGTHTVTYYSVDRAGNVEVQKTVSIKIDMTPPSSSALQLPRYTTADSIMIFFSTSDLTSGISLTELWMKLGGVWVLQGAYPSSPISYAVQIDGEHQFRTIAIDRAGSREGPAPPTANDTYTWVDRSAPVTQAALSGTMGSNGWYASGVTLTLTAADATTAVAATFYSIDGGNWTPSTGTCTVAIDGPHTIAYYSVDVAGNAEPQRYVAFKIDTGIPAGVANAQPSFRVTRTFDVAWSAFDATSGLFQVRLYYSGDGGNTWAEYGNGFSSSPVAFVSSAEGDYAFNVRAYDLAGNSEPAPVNANDIEASTLVDTLPPETSQSLSGSQGLNSWYNSSVVVMLSAVDPSPGSGPATTWYRIDENDFEAYIGPFAVSVDGIHVITYHTSDNAGNTEQPKTATIKIDTGMPSSEVFRLSQYTNEPLIVLQFNASDATSGLAGVELWVMPPGAIDWTLASTSTSSPVSYKASAEGLHRFRSIALDLAGNREELLPSGVDAQVTLDTSAPVTLSSLSGTIGLNGWYTSDVTVTLTASDGGSGVDITVYSIDGGGWLGYVAAFAVSGDGVHKVWFYSVDNAGNIEFQGTVEIWIDSTPPVISYNLYGVQGTSGWHRSEVMMAVAASDATSGMSATQYGVDGACATPYNGPFLVTGEGTHTVSYCGEDEAGNQIQSSTTVKVDTVPPVSTLASAGNSGLNGWYKGDVTLTFTTTDTTSGSATTLYSIDGLVWNVYSGPFIVSGEGAHTVSYYSKDAAGCLEAQRTVAIRIDSWIPVSSAIPLRPSLGRTFQVYFTAHDDMSGMNSVQLWFRAEGSVSFALYGTFTSSPIEFISTSEGYHEFYTVARDMAGNYEDHKTLPEAVTKVEARNDPATSEAFDSALGDLRSTQNLMMILLAILIFVSIILTAVGMRSVTRGLRGLSRRVEGMETRLEAKEQPREPVPPPRSPPIISGTRLRDEMSSLDYGESIEDEIGTEEDK